MQQFGLMICVSWTWLMNCLVVVSSVIFCHVDEHNSCTSNCVVRELLALDIKVRILWFMFLSFNMCFFYVSVTSCLLCSFVFGLFQVTLWSPIWDCWVALWSVCSLYHEKRGFIRGQPKGNQFFFARSVFHNMQTFNINYDIICTLYN